MQFMVSSKDCIHSQMGAVSFNLTTYLQSCSKYISLVSGGIEFFFDRWFQD